MAEKEYRIKESSLNKIGDSIREKTNSTTLYSVSEMPDAIRSISTVIPEGYIKPEGVKDIAENGSYDVTTYAEVQVHVEERVPEQEKELEVVHNGTYTITPDADYVLNKAVVKVNVADIPAVLQEKEIEPTKQEQIVAPDSGYEGMSKVIVKPIPSEYLIPEGNLDITDTNEYDISAYATVQIKDDNLKPENIAEDAEVLGIKGTFKGGIDTSDGTITPDKVLKDEIGYAKDEHIVGTIETWDGTVDGEYKLYNSLNDYLTGSKTKITKEDLAGLTELRVYAFAYSPITEVEFPDSVVRLGDRAFYNTKITSINLEGITYIGQYTFSYTPIKELVLPASIKNYGQRCFENCQQLETVRIESQAGLPPHCFQYDTKLKRVICLLETPPNIYADQFKQFKGGETIEVLPDKVETYKSATNWSNYADYIIAYEGD
jgi:hypothetical protein